MGRTILVYLWADGDGHGEKCVIGFNEVGLVHSIEVTLESFDSMGCVPNHSCLVRSSKRRLNSISQMVRLGLLPSTAAWHLSRMAASRS